MKLSTLFITLLIASISFGQYIEQATIKVKDKDITIQAKDIVYLNKKHIQFRNAEYPYVLSNLKVKHIENMSFDSAQYQKSAPRLNETFSPKRDGKGIYLTMDDVVQNKLTTDRKYKIKNMGVLGYEFEGDLLDVVDEKGNRLKNIAGILHNGEVYLSVKNISKNEAEDQKGSYVLHHPANTFVRVKYIGEDFFYFEMPLQTMGNFILTTSLGMGGAIGGALSGIVATSVPSNYRPIIKYHSDDAFHTFKNCEQFNEHFGAKNADMKIDCENSYNLNSIREKIITVL